MKAIDLRVIRGREVTQEELAREVGLNLATLTDIENARIGIDQETYVEIKAGIGRVAARKHEREEVKV